jgi:hypothetical protein
MLAEEVSYWLSTVMGSVLGQVLWEFWWTEWCYGGFSLSASVSHTSSHSINCITFVNDSIIGAI